MMLYCITQRKAQNPRAGFTLIEIMIAIVIVAVLMGLLLPALGRARTSAQIARVQSEMESLKASITQFKVRFGIDPPSSITIHPPASPTASWDARSRGLLKRMWPQFDFATSGGLAAAAFPTPTTPITLTGAEYLVFFLGGIQDTSGSGALIGFSKNPATPFTTGTGSREGPFFEFHPDRLKDTSTPTNNAPEYLDPWPSQTTPYLYFSSYGGTGYRNLENGHEDLNNNGTLDSGEDLNGNGELDIRLPYYANSNLTAPYNKDSFQLISPGPDTQFGSTGIYKSGSTADLDEYEFDNITNFHQGLLEN